MTNLENYILPTQATFISQTPLSPSFQSLIPLVLLEKTFFHISFPALALTLASGQRRQQPARGYGAPQAAPAPAPQPTYQTDSSQLSQARHDHQGLDWLLESVPGQPGTDYPIYSQEQLGGFQFDCGNLIEGGQ